MPDEQRRSDLVALARCATSERPAELCGVCGATTRGAAICGPCGRSALRVLARAYLALLNESRWDGADEEWGRAETRHAGTRFVEGSSRTTIAGPDLLAHLRAVSRAPLDE